MPTRRSGLSRVLPGPLPNQPLADIGLSFAAGTFTVITGPSGSGKSSLP
jgi:ABC-type lipoprotein export system ATPase subunit